MRVCAVHNVRLVEREAPLRDTSGLFCLVPLPGEKHGHHVHVWNVMVGKRLVASGSFHPNHDQEHIWLEDDYFHGAREHILAVIEAQEAPRREMRVRNVARVSESTVEDWK